MAMVSRAAALLTLITLAAPSAFADAFAEGMYTLHYTVSQSGDRFAFDIEVVRAGSGM